MGDCEEAKRGRCKNTFSRWVSGSSAFDILMVLTDIDSGGIRGIIELTILRAIMAQVNREYSDELRIQDLFDLVIGTSTGKNRSETDD